MTVPGRDLPATGAERGQARLGAAVDDRERAADVDPPADGVDHDVAHLAVGARLPALVEHEAAAAEHQLGQIGTRLARHGAEGAADVKRRPGRCDHPQAATDVEVRHSLDQPVGLQVERAEAGPGPAVDVREHARHVEELAARRGRKPVHSSVQVGVEAAQRPVLLDHRQIRAGDRLPLVVGEDSEVPADEDPLADPQDVVDPSQLLVGLRPVRSHHLPGRKRRRRDVGTHATGLCSTGKEGRSDGE